MANTVLLIRNAAATDFGGGERVPVNIGAELKTNGYSPIIVSRTKKLLSFAQEKNLQTIKGWWWSRQDWSGKKIVLVPLYLLWELLLTAWYMQLIVRTKASVVHPQSKDDFIAASIAGYLLGKKVVWSDYADLKYVYQNNKIWYKNPIGKIVKFLDRIPAGIILTSFSDKSLIETSLGEQVSNNYEVVHYGVPRKEIEIVPRPEKERGSVIYAATSRLVTAKGIGELIDAFNELCKTHEHVRLWIFGEGPEEEVFKKQASGNSQITFWGFPPDTLNRVADCDVFVHPSYLEGFSISLVEAAKLGLPIIACNVGGNPELVKEGVNGILVPAMNANELGKAMLVLAEDQSLRKEYGKNARKEYESDLVFEDIIKDKIIPIYEK